MGVNLNAVSLKEVITMETSCCFKMVLTCLNFYHQSTLLRTAFGESLHRFSQSLSQRNTMIDISCSGKDVTCFQLKTEWTVKWNWDAWRTPENTEISLSAHFVWQATITACILWEKEKKSLIVITCHQTSWCDNPSVCSSHRFVAQNQRHDSSESRAAYGIWHSVFK